MRSVAVLAAAFAGCALALWFGSVLAGWVLDRLGRELGSHAAAVETIYTLTIFGLLLLVAAGGSAWCGLNPLRLGVRPDALLVAGLMAGATGILAATILAGASGSLTRGGTPPGELATLLWGSAVILFAATAEEVYFRGWLQPALVPRFGVMMAVVISAIAFAALHLVGGARSPTTLVNLFLGGLLFGMLAARGGGLIGAVAAHFAWNWSEQIVLGLDPNPGVGSFGAFVDLDLVNRPLWGGSAEGLNGGVGMTVALFALLVPAVMMSRNWFAPRKRLVG